MISSLIKSTQKVINHLYEDYNTTKVDNLIVGGGIIGTSLAYQLSLLKNKSTILIDKNSIGSGASCLSAGTIYSPFDKIPSLEIIKQNIDSYDLIKSYLSIGTIDIIKSIDKKINCDFTESGSITIGSKRTKKYLSEMVNNGLKYEQKLELINSDVYAYASSHVNPCKTVNAFAELSKENGVKIFNNTYIKKIKYNNGKYNITLNNSKKYSCQNLILTNGIGVNNTTKLLGIHVPIIPVKGIIWNIKVPNDKNFKNIIFSSDSSYTWSKNPTIDIKKSIPNNCTHDVNGKVINHNYINFNRFFESIIYKDKLNIEHFYGKSYKDDDGNFNIMFGFNRQVGSNEYDYDIDEKQVNECFIKIKKLFPFIKNTEIDSYWIGLMPFSIYNRPIVGNFSCFGYPNLWIANGFGPSGIAIGPMTTKLLSNIISNNDIEAKLLLEKFNVIDSGCELI